MNKTAIKNFAVWARNELIAEITYKIGLLGITETGISTALPQSGGGTEYYDIGTRDPYAISGIEIRQRRELVTAIRELERTSDYQTAYTTIIDETAYTWFNRLIAIRFMEVNDYLPSRIRVLSSLSGKVEPDIVTTPFEALLEYTDEEKNKIAALKNDDKADELFQLLFLKQCNALNEMLPFLFEKVSDYTEMLLTISYTDKDGVVYHLMHDIPEEDFNVEIGGQVEIIGWLYQYYNTEPKAKVFTRASGTKIKKDEIPAATQLFTPDWIVRYMVENSLGRLWIEGHPNDELKAGWRYYLDEAEQELEVEEQLVKIREKYSVLQPEEILCVDPCSGSGHILCYFFDILMQIYQSQGYSQRDAARSILKNNIYGLDIDDRAYQLSYFAVMMKARQYDKRIFSQGIQPHIYRIVESNGLNCDQLKYFGKNLDEIQKNNALNQIKELIDALHDAKEYGSLLIVENYDWDLLRKFAEDYKITGQINLDTIGMEKTQELLKAFINVGEVLAKQYHISVTNPPYMSVSNNEAKVQDFVKKNYPDSKADLFAVFIERCGQLTKKYGYQAMITQHSWMFLSGFEKLRTKLLQKDTINMAHFGARAFEEIGGEVVQTTSFVIRQSHVENYKGTYSRLIEPNTQQGKENMFLNGENRYFAQQNNFSKIPGTPVAYWCSNAVINVFSKGRPLGEIAEPRQGVKTLNNDLFLRAWFEINPERASYDCQSIELGKKWFPYNKGGGFRKWYGNNEYLVNWENNGHDMKALAVKKYHSVTRTITNISYFFLPGLTWSSLSSGNISMRAFGQGFIFDSKGSSMFFSDRNLEKYILALINSKISMKFLEFLAPTLDYNIGPLSKIPVLIEYNKMSYINEIVVNCIDISKADWDSFETSWDFQRHPLIHPIPKIETAFSKWEAECADRFNQLKWNEEKLNRIFIDIYDLQEELIPDEDDKDVTVHKADLQRDIKSLISYAVGCMFGRFSLYTNGLFYAGGEWDYRTQMERLNKAAKDSELELWNPGSLFLPDEDNIIPITDEEYFEDDIVGLFCNWLKAVYGPDTLEENLDFIAQVLGNKGSNSREVIRNYFINDFFKDHCKTYSVTGSGKRPIYWLYDSGKQNGFKALVYMHRYDADTTGKVRVSYLHRMEKILDGEMNRMDDTIASSHDSREITRATKRKEKLRKQLKECHEYDEKIAPIALSRIDIDLDDGVKVNYCKAQTDNKGKFHEILADSKMIMAKEK